MHKKISVISGIVFILCLSLYLILSYVANVKVKELIENEITNIKKEFPSEFTSNLFLTYDVKHNLITTKTNINNLDFKYKSGNEFKSYLKIDNITIIGNKSKNNLNVKIDNILFNSKKIDEITNESEIITLIGNYLKTPISLTYNHSLFEEKSLTDLSLKLNDIGILKINILSSIYDPYFRNEEESKNYISKLSLYKAKIRYKDNGGITSYINTLDSENLSKYDLINDLNEFKNKTDNEEIFINQFIDSLISLILNEKGDIIITLDSEDPIFIPFLMFFIYVDGILSVEYEI